MSTVDVPKILGLFDERQKSEPLTIPPDITAPLVMRHQTVAIYDTLDHAKRRHEWAESLNPSRRRGRATLDTAHAFIAWVQRFKRPESAVFATADELLAIIDYHAPEGAGAPGLCAHRAVHHWPHSEEWTFWSSIGKRSLTHAQLAEVVEDRIGDVVDLADPTLPAGSTSLAERLGLALGGPSTLLGVSRGIEIFGSTRVASAQNTNTGEIRVVYEERSGDAPAAQNIPTGFLVSIPVFEGGETYIVTVRLKRALKEGALTWRLEPQRLVDIVRAAREDVIQRVRDATGLPVLDGYPETMGGGDAD